MFRYEIQWGLANVGISSWEEDSQDEQSQSELTLNQLANNGIEGIAERLWGFKILRSRDDRSKCGKGWTEKKLLRPAA